MTRIDYNDCYDGTPISDYVLKIEGASAWASVQFNMVKTHMATGRNTPPPQQYLSWLTSHSGKRRRFVVYTTQKKQPPFCSASWWESATLHMLVQGEVQTRRLIWFLHYLQKSSEFPHYTAGLMLYSTVWIIDCSFDLARILRHFQLHNSKNKLW